MKMTARKLITIEPMEIGIIASVMQNSKKIRRNTAKSSTNQSPNEQNQKKRANWTDEEDSQLLKLVNQLGQKWTKIGKIIGNRTGKQVRDRYLYSLRPGISKDKWTEEEDELILSRYEIYGTKWSRIGLSLPGRSESQIKNRFNLRLKKILASRKEEEYSEDFKGLKYAGTKIWEINEVSEDYVDGFARENSLFADDIENAFENWMTEEHKQNYYDKLHYELSDDISMFFVSFSEKET